MAPIAIHLQAPVSPPPLRMVSPPASPGELPNWHLLQADPATSDSPDKTPPRTGGVHSPTLKFHPYVLPTDPATRKTVSKKDMFVPPMLQALTQPDLMDYYQNFTQPYMLQQQMLYVDPSTLVIPPTSRLLHDQ